MKRLLLLRHGKSDWSAGAGDHDRPLTPRGRRAAALVGRFLTAAGEAPEAVWSSPARRAHDTALRACKAGRWPVEVTTIRRIYEATPQDLFELAQEADPAWSSLLLVGHQPTLSAFAGGLVGGARLHFPTANLVRLDLEIEGWRELRLGGATLNWMVRPKLLQRAGFPGA